MSLVEFELTKNLHRINVDRMKSKTKKTPQQKADQKNNEKRKGTPTFSAVRFVDGEQSALEKKVFVESVISDHGGTREAALIDAFKCLSKQAR